MSRAPRLTEVPKAAQVALGEQLSLAVTVRHTGHSSAHYRLDVSGIPADWYTLDRPYLALDPAASAQVLLTVHPPARPVTIAGRYTLTVHVRAAEDPDLQTATAVALTVRTSGGVDMDMQPGEAVGRRGVFHITFLNQMTWPVDVALTAHDAENGLRFRIEPETPVVVPATGVAGPVTVHVVPRVRALLGEPRPYEIEFHALDLGSLQQNEQRARFVYVPRYPAGRLPVWLRRAPGRAVLFPLVLLLLLLVVAGGRALARPATRLAVTPPAPAPTRAVSHVPRPRPTATPTVRPTATPTQHRTTTGTARRHRLLIARPTATPTPRPTATPTPRSTETPTAPPTATPTLRPAATPTLRPAATPTAPPTATPTPRPTATPTPRPTVTPTARPTVTPTARPTRTPTPVAVTIGSTTPPVAAVTSPTAVPVTWP